MYIIPSFGGGFDVVVGDELVVSVDDDCVVDDCVVDDCVVDACVVDDCVVDDCSVVWVLVLACVVFGFLPSDSVVAVVCGALVDGDGSAQPLTLFA